MCNLAEHMAISSDSSFDDASGASSASAIARYIRESYSDNESDEGDVIFTTSTSKVNAPPMLPNIAHDTALLGDASITDTHVSDLYAEDEVILINHGYYIHSAAPITNNNRVS